jgi:subtilisin family serine protease
VVGVNWSVQMLSAKFLGPNGGTLDGAVKAVDYFTGLKARGVNVVATNNSWGGGGYSRALQDAIERANARGILFVAASGNGGRNGRGDNNDRTPSYPSSYPNANVIAVSAIDRAGGLASFSNFGARRVDLGAPGVAIWSAVPGGYASYSGTSMATPHVTGAAALYAAAKPGALASQIKAALLGSAVPTGSLTGKTVGGGRLDANGALSR